LAAKTAALMIISLIAAGLLGFGLAQNTSINFGSEENVSDFFQKSVPSESSPVETSEKSITSEFSQKETLVIPSSSTDTNP